MATFADTRVAGYADRYLRFAEAIEARFDRAVDATRHPGDERRDDAATA